jgi:ABC-type multidrug transport system fused ATPase/permease subunit
MGIERIKQLYKRYLNLVSSSDRKKVKAIIIVQIFVSFLDAIGVALIGVVGTLSVAGIQSSKPSGRILEFIQLINLEEYSFQNQVAIIGLLAAFVLLLRTFISIYFTRKTLYFFSLRGAQLSKDLIRRLLSQNLLKIQERSSQETLFATTYGSSALMVGVFGNFVNFIADFSLMLILLGVLIFVDPVIALCTTLLLGSTTFALYKKLNRRAGRLGKLDSALNIESSSNILEVLATYRESVVRNRRKYYVNKISKLRTSLAITQAEVNFMPSISKYVVETTIIFASIFVACLQFLTKDAQQSIATLSVFMATASRLAPTLLRLQQGSLFMRNNIGTADSTLKLMDSLSDTNRIDLLEDENLHFDYPDFNAGVKLQNVSLTYPNGTRPALDQVSLCIEPGSFVGFVGPSGAGKTTIVDTLLGVLIPDSGEVLISGFSPLTAIAMWPGAISYLPQDVFISQGTVRENVSLGYPIEIASDEKVLECLKLAHLDDFVLLLPQGIDSEVGENGAQLSGGQRQRLGIARALFTKPLLLVLDEATSALDAETEAAVSDAISALKGETTIVMIAHRLSSVQNADLVFYLSDGKLLASGTFDEVRTLVPSFDDQAKLMGL